MHHVAHTCEWAHGMNEWQVRSLNTYRWAPYKSWAMSHIWIRHVIRMNEPCRTHMWVSSLNERYGTSHIWISDDFADRMHTSEVNTRHGPCYTHKYVTSHIWMSEEWAHWMLTSRLHRGHESRVSLNEWVPLCNTLQHTATHCNTLQYTATHCNTLQHTSSCVTSVMKWMSKLVGSSEGTWLIQNPRNGSQSTIELVACICVRLLNESVSKLFESGERTWLIQNTSHESHETSELVASIRLRSLNAWVRSSNPVRGHGSFILNHLVSTHSYWHDSFVSTWLIHIKRTLSCKKGMTHSYSST